MLYFAAYDVAYESCAVFTVQQSRMANWVGNGLERSPIPISKLGFDVHVAN
jgi:hypothetical protein